MELHYHDSIWRFINTLQKPTQYKALRQLDLLEKYGHSLGLPHAKRLNQQLFELRIRGQQEVRLIYNFKHNKCFILHGFIKKTNKTPAREIATALKRLP